MDRVFPVVDWGGLPVTFHPYSKFADAAIVPGAALVFAFQEDRIVLADIEGRGWCIPGGRLEPGENAYAAARREAWEECGAILGTLVPLGWTTKLNAEGSETVLAVSYTAPLARLDPIPVASESRGVRLVERDELPACYYHWDALMEAMFDFAWEHRALHSFHSTAESTP